MPNRRYLLGILVYNGRDVVVPCLASAAQLSAPNVDVVVFDDCSPSPGWSEELAELCRGHQIGYYRTPRNLGIPRNMSLAMRAGIAGGYDIVGLVNSDVILPANLCAVADTVFDSDDRIASVTPWSNNVSAFSLPMEGDDGLVADQEFVTEFSESLNSIHHERTLSVPTGVGYCLLITTTAIRSVGVMDPIFGRGYCEEVDWCQRVNAARLVNALSLGMYVYHAGSGTNRTEGLLAHGMTTVPEHESMIRWRYPDYLDRVREFLNEGTLDRLGQETLAEALQAMCRSRGYSLAISGTDLPTQAKDALVVLRTGHGELSSIRLGGLHARFPTGRYWQPELLQQTFGTPSRVVAYEPGSVAQTYVSWARIHGIPVDDSRSYPGQI